MPHPRATSVLTAALIGASFVGCSRDDPDKRPLLLATTTSTRDSGLLEALIPVFEKQSGIEVKVVAVGSGQALEMGRRGDADVLLTHAPDAELEFVRQGHGESRLPVMHNDFVLVGPESAAGADQDSIVEAFRQLAAARSPFVSRGDESGTHIKEQAIWREAGVRPDGEWYIAAGAGMSEALRIASQKGARTLSDRGTYLAQREGLELAVLSEGDPLLRNQYAVIVVDPRRHPHVRAAAARRLADFLLSPDAQRIIARHGVDRHGQPLFFPLKATRPSGA